MRKFFFTFFPILTFLAANVFALSLEEYLDQVTSQNLGYNAAILNAESYELLKEKAKLVNAVKLYGYSESSFTDQNQALQIFRYKTVYSQKNQAGFSHISDFGLSTNLYYSLNKTKYRGLNAAPLAVSNYQTVPTLELSLPLWQNLFGLQTKASRDSTYFKNESQKMVAKALSVEELMLAEKTYFAAIYAQKNVAIHREALESAKKILQYVSKREKMNLGEKADVLQAKALVESKKLALAQAENDEKITARNFNGKRFISSDKIVTP